MTFYDWLATQSGIALEHAVIGLLVAITGFLTYATKRKAEKNAKLLNSHLERHVMDELEGTPRDN